MTAKHTPGPWVVTRDMDAMTDQATKPLCYGDLVLCRENSIDKPYGRGLTGRVTGFARLSAYHQREVMVDGIGWVWEQNAQRVDA